MRQARYTQFGGPEVIEIVEVPVPEPGPKEVRVRAHTIGVGRWDVLQRTGKYPFPIALPATMGLDMSGVIDAVGSEITDLKPGDKVYVANGRSQYRCYADQVVASRREAVLLDDNVDLESAICLGTYVAARNLLHDAADLTHVRMAAMNGAAGAVGVAMAQICQAANIDFIAITSSRAKADFALANGATHAICTEEENLAERMLELTQGRGLDLLFDQVVGPNFRDNLKFMAPLGQIVTINALGGLPSSDLFADLRANVQKGVSVRAFSAHVYEFLPERRKRNYAAVMELFAAGALKAPVTERFALDDAMRAHQRLDEGGLLGKMVLKP